MDHEKRRGHEGYVQVLEVYARIQQRDSQETDGSNGRNREGSESSVPRVDLARGPGVELGVHGGASLVSFYKDWI